MPSRTRFPVLLNLFDKCLHILYAQANASERMDCHSTNVTRSNAYENVLALQPTRIKNGGLNTRRRSYRYCIRRFHIFFMKGFDSLAQKNRFASSWSHVSNEDRTQDIICCNGNARNQTPQTTVVIY
jgi:hypothetical protein